MTTTPFNQKDEKGFSGLKILETGHFISAAYGTKLFADLGAEVIKIEEQGTGDETRSYGPFPDDIPHPEKSGLFLYLNNNKKGVTLNIRTATGKEIFKKLIAQCDILMENHPPSFLQEEGLTHEDLRSLNPRLITASITPFGRTGPYKDYKGRSINCAAAGGEAGCIGEPSREPLAPPASLGSYQAGAMAASAVMVAVMAGEKDGLGRHVDVSEAEVWARLHTSLMIHNFVYKGAKRVRAGHRTPGFYPYTILPCKDGHMSLIAVVGSQWKKFLEIIGEGEVPDWYAGEPKFKDRWVNSLEHADELDGLLAPWLMSHTKQEIFDKCREKQIPFNPVRRIDEVVDSKDLNQRRFFIHVDHPYVGKTVCPGAPYKFKRMTWKIRTAAPCLGQHNEEIYCNRLGYSKQDLSAMRKASVI